MTKEELYILSFYRASELAGALLFGRIAMHTDVDDLRIPLTEQCAEEARHAWMITELLEQLGQVPMKVTQTFQSEIAKDFGMPENVLEVLALTQIFEVRVLEHYQKHVQMKGVHPKIKSTLTAMIADEEGHVDWIEKRLNKYSHEHGQTEVDKLLDRVRKVDSAVVKRLSSSEPFKSYFKEIL